MENMKLLMENWRQYSALIEDSKQIGNIYLFENKSPVKTDFNILLKEYDNGKITGDKLYECWRASILYEHKILNEGFGDLAKKGAAAVKGAWEKLNNWILQKSVQLYQLAKRGIEKTVGGAKVLLDKAADFKSEHPVAFKITTVVVMSIAMFALISALDADSAEAAIKSYGVEGGMKPGARGEISDAAYEALRGLVHETKNADLGGTSMKMRAIAMKIIDAAQASGEVVDFSKLTSEFGKLANEQLQILEGMVALAKEGDETMQKYVVEMIELGEKVTYKVMGQSTR